MSAEQAEDKDVEEVYGCHPKKRRISRLRCFSDT